MEYRVLFFGTYEVGIIDIKCLFAYEENKARFARPNKKRFFMEALEEIEKRPGMKPPVTHVMGRIGGEKKPKDSSLTPVQPSAKDSKAKEQTPACVVKDAKTGVQGAVKNVKVTQVFTKETTKTTLVTAKEAKVKDSRSATATAVGTTILGGPAGKETLKKSLIPERKSSANDNTERRKTDPITAGGKGDKKSEKPQQQQKRISLTRPPLRDAHVSPKRKRSEAPAEKTDVMAVSSSPEEKPLQHSRAGRAIKPKKLDDELVEIETKSPRKSQTPSPDAKKERRYGPAVSGKNVVKTEPATSLSQHKKLLPKGRRKTLPPAESERSDSPTTKRTRITAINSETERKSGPPMNGSKAATTGASSKKVGVGNIRAPIKEVRAHARGDEDEDEVCSECHRRSPRKHDHLSQGEDDTPGPNMSLSVVIETNPNLVVNSKPVAVSVVQARSLKQDGRTSKSSSEDTTEPAKTLREESKARGAPSADELKKQVAFLELTDKKIRANMGGERMDPDSALDAIVVLEGSFITAPALMRFPKILNTLRHVRRYPTNERLAQKADFMYNKIKNYMMTVFISEDEKAG
ncbi:hepatoma-derived growth factor-related protein 2-like [Varroa jacobsoni]|uniref:hepatoma-derived growth factor-related protein 2-like n=1 Tax=Varroa jacobsoni TaxID=62625 RepID=UPI000BF58BB1|nr:hepatoma-derived growth factor-related protein 2-like [Varroa jacobsoni]